AQETYWRQHQNESLAIDGRNVFDDEASSSNNIGAKPLVHSKTLWEHSLPSSAGLKRENPIHHIKHYLSIVDNIRADGATRDTSRPRLFHFSLKGKAKEWHTKIPSTQITTWDQLVAWFLDYFFLVGRTSFLCPSPWDIKWLLVQIFHDNISQKDQGKLDQFARFCFSSLTEEEGAHEADECDHNNLTAQVCLSGGDIYDDLSLLRGIHEQFSQILSEIKNNETTEPDTPTFAITTRSGTSTRDPPYPTPPEPTTIDHTKRTVGKEGPEGAESSITRDEEAPWSSIFYQPSKLSNLRFPSRPVQSSLVKSVPLSSKEACPKKKETYVGNGPRRVGLDHSGMTFPRHSTGPEDKRDFNEVQAVSFYPRTEPVDPFEWKTPENQLKPSSIKPPELELKELPEHLEYAFL
ncbi:hypothetical protein Tco_1306218, partial [Tanacetum coccineum]